MEKLCGIMSLLKGYLKNWGMREKRQKIFLKEIFFDEEIETFRSSYEKLNQEIVLLFQQHFLEMKNGTRISSEQPGGGSYHRKRDFAEFVKEKGIDWNETIHAFKERYGMI